MKSIINKEEEKKLTIDKVAPYIPFGVKVRWNGKNETIVGVHLSGAIIEGGTTISFGDCSKILLRPLSDLTKEIEVNGERFVPAGKMITHGFHNTFWYELDKFNYQYLYAMDYEKLLSWHFNVFNLPEELYVDINTL